MFVSIDGAGVELEPAPMRLIVESHFDWPSRNVGRIVCVTLDQGLHLEVPIRTVERRSAWNAPTIGIHDRHPPTRRGKRAGDHFDDAIPEERFRATEGDQ